MIGGRLSNQRLDIDASGFTARDDSQPDPLMLPRWNVRREEGGGNSSDLVLRNPLYLQFVLKLRPRILGL